MHSALESETTGAFDNPEPEHKIAVSTLSLLALVGASADVVRRELGQRDTWGAWHIQR